MAPITRVPSRPRLMRPERSVMHSPRLTNRNGVETRIAPPNTASGTVQSPIVPSAMSGFAFQKANSPIQRVACEHKDEDNSLQYLDRSVRQAEPALQQAAAGADAAEQDGDGNNGKRILPRQKCNKNTRKTVAGGKVGVGAALHGRDLDHSGEAGRRARQKADRQNELADAKAHDLGRADLAGRWLVEAGGVAHHALDQMVEDGERDIDQQQARNRFIDAAVLAKPAGEHDPQPAAD